MPANSAFLQSWLEPLLGRWLYVDSTLWTVVGFLGATIFGSRFLLQWLHSEKEKKLIVPWYFWHLSFWGSVLNLLYFLHLDKAPLILGNCFLPIVYGRSILFLRAEGEKGRGRFVFAAVAALTLVGFVASKTGSNAGSGVPPEYPPNVMRAIKALSDYKSDLHELPEGDARSIVRKLCGENPHKIRYFDLDPATMSPEGDWLDPWGQPYRVFISEGTVIIRSAGQNGKFDDGLLTNRDDVLIENIIR